MEKYVRENLPDQIPGRHIEEQKVTIDDPDGKNAKDALDTAKIAAIAAAPTITLAGLCMMFHKDKDRYGFGDLIKLLGVPVAVGGLVIDTVKFPIASTISISALLWSGLLKIKSLMTRESSNEKQTNEIMQSFSQRFGNTMRLLIGLKLETLESINTKIQESLTYKNHKGLETLCALTALNTAYASRCLSTESILLANGKVLHRKNCPTTGLVIFDHVIRIRDQLKKLNFHRKSNREVTPILMDWLPGIKLSLESDSNQIKDLLMASHAPGSTFPSLRTFEILEELVLIMKHIGNQAVQKKPLKENTTYMQYDLNRQYNQHPFSSSSSSSGSLSTSSPAYNRSLNLLRQLDTNTHGIQMLNQQTQEKQVKQENQKQSINQKDQTLYGSLHRSLQQEIHQEIQPQKLTQPLPLPLLVPESESKNKSGIMLLDKSLNQVQGTTKDIGTTNVIDFYTKKPIIDFVIGSDGRAYERATAEKIMEKRIITHYIKCYSNDLKLDPITCEELEDPVVANDGHLYSRVIALQLISNKFVGVGGIVLTDYIKCNF